MARKYTSKDIKSMIDKHTEILESLENSFSQPTIYGNKIQTCINNMFSSGVFASDVMDSLKGRESYHKERFEELIMLLYLFKRAAQQSRDCKAILLNNKDRIDGLIKEATAGANAITWLFASSKKKRNSEEAYEKLMKEIDDGDYWTLSQKVISDMAGNDSVPTMESWKDFQLNVTEYQDILKANLPAGLGNSEVISDLNQLIGRFENIAANFEKETQKTETIKTEIKFAAERMITANVLDILKTVPVEEINRGKKGLRAKALREAGFTTMADLYSASSYQLATVHGISEDASYTIKSIAKDFAVEAKNNAKIKISVDNRTKDATKLVAALFRYRQYIKALEALDRLKFDYDYSIKNAITDLHSVGNGVYWIFFDDDKKENIKKSFSFLSQEIDGDYKNKSNEIVRMFRNAGAPMGADAWDDFKDNSISYYTVLEDIVPGVLGNDDRLYGLPEDLAREIQEECFFPDGLNCELRRYQEWGVKYILHQERVLLGDEMGLGKTVQAIAAMVSLRNTGATHFIVVCPASVLPNWCKEIAAKSKLRVTKVHGAGRTQAIKSWMKTGGVAVTTYETTKILQFDAAFSFDLLVVDEAHFIKNINAVRSRNVRYLAGFTKRILFMTGTALENNVDEMISLIDVLQPNVAKSIKSIAFMSTAPQFREKIAGVYYRRRREDVHTELPDLIESREWCTMSAEETRIYEQDVLSKSFMGTRRLSWNVASLDQSCKACRMTEIINEAESEGRKVLIFSFFLDTIRKIYEYLGDRCCNPINGSVPPQRRQEIIDQFNDDPKKTVLCAQIQSGGTGLNIQAASVVIICEPQFKPSIENQAISRAYRMGQARNVLVYRLLCEDTIDERITELLEEKQAIFDAFADKSVAAANTEKQEKEVDETTFGKIIEEEIERIKAKGGAASFEPEGVVADNASQFKNKESVQCETADVPEFETKYALTSSSEYADELSMDYDHLVKHLLEKYGKAKGNYFLTEKCASKNKKIVRANEGLFCHHIDEDKAIMLSDDKFAIRNPFDYQKADRLVYCNILEHLILHIKIVEKPKGGNANSGEIQGIGGAVNYITRQINDYYNHYEYKQQYMITAMSYIKDNFDDYIKILKYLWSVIQSNEALSLLISKKQLVVGWNGNIVDKVYNLL